MSMKRFDILKLGSSLLLALSMLAGCSGDAISEVTVSSISVSPTAVTVLVGESTQLVVACSPSGSSLDAVVWSSSNPSVATVEDGLVTGVAVGSATITALSGSLSASASVTVEKEKIAVTGITLSLSSLSLEKGDKATLQATVSPSDATDPSVTWVSSDESVVTVIDGAVTAVGGGTASVTAFAGDYSAQCAVTVTVPVQGVALSPATMTLAAGDDATLTAVVSPSDATDRTLSWTSSDPSVLAVDEQGKVTALKVGTATITVAAGSYKATCSVTVLASVISVESVVLSAETLTLEKGASSTLTASVLPLDATDPSVSWISSDTGVVTVDEKGKVTAISGGTATITATAGTVSATCVVTVHVPVTGISLDKTDISLYIGSSATLTATLTPSDATDKSLAWSSSDGNVATVDANGKVTAVSTGTAMITVSASGLTASCTVTCQENTGTRTFDFGDTEASEDNISSTSFDRTVYITYSTSGSASVSGDTDGSVSVSGNDVTVNYTGSDNIVYELSGTTTDGFFKLYGSKKQAIYLNGVSITNKNGAAINNQNKKRTFIIVSGSNTLADGSSYTDTPSSEDEKAALFSEGQLIFTGTGSLTVTAKGKAAITSDDYVRFMSCPTIKVTSTAGHGVRGKDAVIISNGTIGITTSAAMKKGVSSDSLVQVTGGATTIQVSGGVAYDSDDAEYKGSAGIKADKQFLMSGGAVTITNTGTGGKGVRAGSYDASETDHSLPDSEISGGTLTINTSGSESNDVSSKGIKIGWVIKSGNSVKSYAGNMKVSGGSVIVTASKSEAFEVKGTLTVSGGEIYASSSADDAINSQSHMNVTGGYVYAYSSKNDAMDANGNMTLSGGYVYAVTTAGSPEVALDANTESKYKLYINSGATVVAYGGLESGASLSQTCYTMSVTAGGHNALFSSSNKALAVFKAPSGVSSVVVSAPSLSTTAYKGVSVSNGTTYCQGYWMMPGTVSGGTSVTLGSYSGGGGSGPGGGGGRR